MQLNFKVFFRLEFSLGSTILATVLPTVGGLRGRDRFRQIGPHGIHMKYYGKIFWVRCKARGCSATAAHIFSRGGPLARQEALSKHNILCIFCQDVQGHTDPNNFRMLQGLLGVPPKK